MIPAFARRKAGANVAVAQDEPRLLLLSAIVWYTILLMAYDSEDVSTGAMAAVVAATA